MSDTIDLTTHRLREMEDWQHANPPESGVVSITRTPRYAHEGIYAAWKARADAVEAVEALIRRIRRHRD